MPRTPCRYRDILTVFVLLAAAASRSQAEVRFDWEELPALPVALTGHFAGVHEGVIFVAGGASRDPLANPPGEVTWYDRIYTLEPGAAQWREVGRLPAPRAFGASVSTGDGVWLFGGSDGTRHYDDMLRLRWRDGDAILELPSPGQRPMPAPIAFTSAAVIGDTAYLFGGLETPGSNDATNHFWSLDLSEAGAAWQVLDPGPVTPRVLSSLTSQDGGLYLAGGAMWPGARGELESVSGAFVYEPDSGWREIAPVEFDIYAAPSVPFGHAHVLIFGGRPAARESDRAPASSRRQLIAYHTITDAWAAFGTLPIPGPGARALPVQDGVMLLGGEGRGGEATDKVYIGALAPRENAFGFLDYTVLALYFALLIGMGLYFSRRERNTEAFFLGGRRIPWWAVGISIFGTSLSAITYISIPGTAYATDWVFILNNIGILFLAPFVVAYYMPRLRENPVTTAYEYLEQRFNLLTRIYGSIVFITFQLGRMAIVLYLPAIALSAATGLNITFCILAMGLFATLYTVLGGIEAVIWTDVVQSVVLVFGALLALVLIVVNIDGGAGAMFTTAYHAGKFHTFNWSWDLTMAAVWVALIGGIFSNGYPAMADQTVVQRYLSTPTAYHASKAVWTNALLTLPIQLLFFGLGTALWVFFKSHPNLIDPSLKNDAILPLFVVEQFPMGLRGVLIAGLFAASMSSLDSSMNSLSSVIVHDYYRRFVRGVTERKAMIAARGLTLLFGLFGTLSALYVATINQSTIFELFLRFLGLVGGGLAGLFVLGVLTKRANGVGALTGAISSGVIMVYVRDSQIHFFLHGMIGFLTAFLIGYAASRLLEGEQEI